MIHKRGAIVSGSGEHSLSLRKDRVRWRSLRAIEGWLGNESSRDIPGAGVRSRTSSVACKNRGIAARRRKVLVVKSSCVSDWGSADVETAQLEEAQPCHSHMHAHAGARQPLPSVLCPASQPDCLWLTNSPRLQLSHFIYISRRSFLTL